MLTDPVVHPEIRQAICQKNRGSSNARGPEIQGGKSENKPQVAQCNKRCLGWRENVGSRIQMGLLVAGRSPTVTLDQTLLAGTGVHEDVGWPAQDLMEDEGSDSDNGCVGS